ncbi:hypothetical protein ACLOJK_009943 [Asimina triloba]
MKLEIKLLSSKDRYPSVVRFVSLSRSSAKNTSFTWRKSSINLDGQDDDSLAMLAVGKLHTPRPLIHINVEHDVRGPQLKDTVDVVALKPCVLTLVEGAHAY